ncbi:MAG: hypothetical protein JWN98_2011 [Abditibacteriota bacterium]|nr:hypothetical protein [Abditibacteriota bacterium]
MGSITRAIHDVGTAIWYGGNIMGVLALNPAVEVLDDPEERGKMVDEGWARFQPWGAAGLAATVVTHILMRRNPPRRPSDRYKTAAMIKDLCLGAACVSSVASMALGEYAMHQEPDAYTPVDSATTGTEETPDDTKAAQSGLTVASWGILISGLGLLVTNAICAAEREK